MRKTQFKQNEITTSNPIELLMLIGLKEERYDLANAAFRRFHGLYIKRIYALSIQYYKHFEIQEEIYGEITYNVLLKIWTKPDSFKPPEGVVGKLIDKKLMSWIQTIVKNEYLLYFRAENRKDKIPRNLTLSYTEEAAHDEEEIMLAEERESEYFKMEAAVHVGSYQMEADEAETIAISERFRSENREIKKFMKTLPEAHRDVFETYLSFEDAKGRLPDGMLDALCKKHGLHKEYPRKIKKRVMEKLIIMFGT
jgi:DNA-directed RNA polymerase specialized sigma24 family protein